MTKLAVENQKYGFSRTVDTSFDEAVEQTVAALRVEGFGVLSEIRIDEKLKERLGVDFRKYIILGAYNPAARVQGLAAGYKHRAFAPV